MTAAPTGSRLHQGRVRCVSDLPDLPPGDRTATPIPEAAYTFYATHFTKLAFRGSIMLRVSEQEAEDAAAFACMELLTRWSTVSQPYAWAEKAMIRKIVRDRSHRLRWRPWRLSGSQADLEIPLPLHCPVDEQNQVRDVFVALRQLKLREQQVMVLLVYGYERAEIAELLGITTNYVYVIISQAREKLRFLLGQETHPVSLGDGLDSVRRDDPVLVLMRKALGWLQLGMQAKHQAERREGRR